MSAPTKFITAWPLAPSVAVPEVPSTGCAATAVAQVSKAMAAALRQLHVLESSAEYILSFMI
jgi:hypothetical protein